MVIACYFAKSGLPQCGEEEPQVDEVKQCPGLTNLALAFLCDASSCDVLSDFNDVTG